ARRFGLDAAPAAAKLTEDPPFGGLWCDQPAIFLWAQNGILPFYARPYTDSGWQKAWFLPAYVPTQARSRSPKPAVYSLWAQNGILPFYARRYTDSGWQKAWF